MEFQGWYDYGREDDGKPRLGLFRLNDNTTYDTIVSELFGLMRLFGPVRTDAFLVRISIGTMTSDVISFSSVKDWKDEDAVIISDNASKCKVSGLVSCHLA